MECSRKPDQQPPLQSDGAGHGWWEQAACAPSNSYPAEPDGWVVDPDWFFSREPDDIERAKGICRQCPVSEQCLQAAFEAGETRGVRGGYTPAERRALLIERRRQNRRFGPIALGEPSPTDRRSGGRGRSSRRSNR